MSTSAPDRSGVVRGIARHRLSDARGGAVVEYVILVGVVALLAIHAFTVFGTDTSTVVHQEGANVAKLGF
jgi:Flp pilus assembly pilin Flp